jgi:hypothetical protein
MFDFGSPETVICPALFQMVPRRSASVIVIGTIAMAVASTVQAYATS